jgi:F-type H+-transporting ATPase subunit alpha
MSNSQRTTEHKPKGPATAPRSGPSPNPLEALVSAIAEALADQPGSAAGPTLRRVPSPAAPSESGTGGLPSSGDNAAVGGLSRALVDVLRTAPQRAMPGMLGALREQSTVRRSELAIRDVGTVRRVGDGVASVWGLPQARTDELLRFSCGVSGLVMNLDAGWIDCILLGSDEGVQGGDVVWSTGERITMPVGDRLLGRVVDPTGNPIDGKGRLYVNERRFIERDAPGVVERQAVSESLETGIRAIDAIVPIGKGQRELIIGDRQTGKTSLALDTIINQRDKDVICVYVSVGQSKTAALAAIRTLEQANALAHTVVVMAAPDDPPALLYIAPYAGCTIAESFLDYGRDVLVVYDDLSKHADAYRELSLLLRRPPGREAYPGDIFYLHSRLLERACRLADSRGGGSITALPIVETQRGNITGYVPTNLISITDGQIYLSPELFNQGIKPAVDVGLSVSRVGGAAQTPIMRQVSGRIKLTLSQYEEVAHFARFGAEIDRTTRQQITRGLRLREALKQPAYAPQSLPQQILGLYAASQGHMDELPVDQVASFEAGLWHLAEQRYGHLLRRIRQEKTMTAELEQEIVELLAEFRRSLEAGNT